MSEAYLPDGYYNANLCIGRGIRDHPKAQPRKLAEIWAKRLCGGFNKDIKLFLVGAQGSGKSHSSIHLAIRVAEEVAKYKGGTWEKYFPADMSHVFIGDAEEHADALKHIRKHNVYILDDAGVSINARNFMTTYNKSLNDIFQTVRTDNALIIINAPDSFLIDNVPRNIVSFYGEVSESQHSVGLNFVKIFKLERKFRTGHTHYHHYQFGSQQVIRWRFRRIPEEMALAYEKRRDEATQKIKSQAGTGKKDPKITEREKMEQQREEVCMVAWEYYRTQEEPTKTKALSRANRESKTITVKRSWFELWMVKRGFA
jgi:hypothetical protein